MVSRLKFHYWNVVVVLALVLCETLVESQYYMEEGSPGPSPVYLYNSDVVQGKFVPTSEGRGFRDEETPGRMFAARRLQVESEEDDEDDDDEETAPSQKSFRVPEGRSRPVKLPPGFDDRIRKRMKGVRKTKTHLHGDPDPIDEEDDDGRRPEARLLWPFSIEITKGNKDKGWGPGGYGSFGPPPFPPPRTGLGVGLGVNGHKVGLDLKHDIPKKQHARVGITKGRFPHKERHDGGHFHVSSGWGPQNGWGWDAFIEHEKHRLKYEILKLKAKKKIAVLQNKVELKKLFSMLLQKKIQALEWW